MVRSSFFKEEIFWTMPKYVCCYKCHHRWNRRHTRDYRETNNMFNILTRAVIPNHPWEDVDIDFMDVDKAMLLHPTNKEATTIQRFLRGWLRRTANVRIFYRLMRRISKIERLGTHHQPQLKDIRCQFLARARVHKQKVKNLVVFNE